MGKSDYKLRPIDIANIQLTRQLRHIVVAFIVPPILITFILAALFAVQEALYPPTLNELGEIITGGRWYNDPFTVVIVGLFVFAQVLALKQFIIFFMDFRKLKSLIDTIAKGSKLNEVDDLIQLAESIRLQVPHSDMRSMVLNWLDYRGDSTVKRNDVLENNNYIRMDLNKEKSSYFHILMNRITLKLGFLGTLIGLMMTFPKMKNAILSLDGSNGEMSFVKDIAAAIDGDQYAILTTLIATVLSLFAEFLTIQLMTRFSINQELITSYLTDWYHTRVEPIYSNESSHSKTESELSKVQGVISENIKKLTTVSEQSAVQIKRLSDFFTIMDKRVSELESYEKFYRELIDTKSSAEERIASNVQQIGEFAQQSSEQLVSLTSSQELIGARVDELQRYEEQYRSLISSKDSASIPSSLRPKGDR